MLNISSMMSGPATTATSSSQSSSKSSSSNSLSNFGSSGSLNQKAVCELSCKSFRLCRNVEEVTTPEAPGESASHEQSLHHLFSCFKAMNQMRKIGQLCDVTLKTPDDSELVEAHRVVLASSSAYFFAMFNSDLKEKNLSEITLQEVDLTALKLIVDFCYTGEISISQFNVLQVLPAASLLQVEQVQKACCEFLQSQLDPSNCLGIRTFADAHSCMDLMFRSHRFALLNFYNVSLTDEFLQQDIEQIEDLVSSNELNVVNEENVFKAIVRWIKHDENREIHVHRLLQHCRMPLIERDFLISKVCEEPMVKRSAATKDLIMEAMKYHLVPEKRTSMTSIRTTLRKPVGLFPYIFAVGGGSLFAIHNDCEFFNPATERWTHFAPTIHRRSRAGVVAESRMLYSIGGFDGIKDLSSAEMYNPRSNTWSLVTPLGTRRSCLGIASLNGLIYVAGGYDGSSCLSSVEQYDPLVGTWCSVGGMEYRRRYCRLSVIDSCLYVVGGHDGASYQSSVERLDPREGKWQLLQSMNARRNSCGVASIGRSLYVMGGNDGSLCMNTCEKFDVVANAWTQIANMHTRRTTHDVVESGGVIYAIGGNDGSSSLNTVEKYHPQEDRWSKVEAMQLRRSSIGAAVIECPPLEPMFF